MNEKIKAIYIVGAGHSGSTLLDAMLDSHKDIVGVGEVLRIHRALELGETCACGEPLGQCPFWSQVITTVNPEDSRFAYRSTIDFFLNRAQFIDWQPEGKHPIRPEAYRAYNRALYKQILAVSGKQIICDSSKDPDRLELLLGDPALDITVVHMVRDGRGVAYSYQKKKKTRRAYRFMYFWAVMNMKVRRLLGRHPGTRVVTVRYEDLITHPEREIRRVLDAVGLPYEPTMLDFKAQPHHHIGSNRRFRKQTDSTLALDLSWKQGLTLPEKLYFLVFFYWWNYFFAIR